MPKDLQDNSVSNTRYHGRGIFTDRCKILSVEDLSNYPNKPGEIKTLGKNGWQPELCLKLQIDAGIEMEMNILGNFVWKKDAISGKNIKYLGWRKKNNAVQNLIVKLGLGKNALLNDDSINPAVLNALVGKEFVRLRYCQPRDKMYEGKPSFQTWTVFNSVYEGAEEDLVAEFNKEMGASKRYDPLLWDDYQSELKAKETSFNPSEFNSNAEEDII